MRFSKSLPGIFRASRLQCMGGCCAFSSFEPFFFFGTSRFRSSMFGPENFAFVAQLKLQTLINLSVTALGSRVEAFAGLNFLKTICAIELIGSIFVDFVSPFDFFFFSLMCVSRVPYVHSMQPPML
jgi:hypothetical protein